MPAEARERKDVVGRLNGVDVSLVGSSEGLLLSLVPELSVDGEVFELDVSQYHYRNR